MRQLGGNGRVVGPNSREKKKKACRSGYWTKIKGTVGDPPRWD